MHVIWIFVTIFVISCPSNSASKIETLKHCCSLGANYANSGLKCNTFQTPVSGVQESDQEFCKNSVDVCCKKQNRELQCADGQTIAKSTQNCADLEDDGGDYRKDCCEACVLGLETGSSGQSCTVTTGLGVLYDSTFTACCVEAAVVTNPSSSTTLRTTIETSTILRKGDDKENIPPQPPLEAVCDIPDLCAHQCVATADSYRCECFKGYSLMADGRSCRPSKQKTSRCHVNNPCDHECVDTGESIQCYCYEGYQLADDKRTCNDIDECVLGIHDCTSSEVCVNLEGGYDCEQTNNPNAPNLGFDDKCPDGYKFDSQRMVCDDIDECEIGIACQRPQTCVNTIGSFRCDNPDTPKCPPGFYFKDSIQNCEDINECLAGTDDCNRESQVCLNTKGNFTCIDKASKKTCPAGFKKNPFTFACEDINECLENENVCNKNEECVNEVGGHTCVPKGNVAGIPEIALPDLVQPDRWVTQPTTTTSAPFSSAIPIQPMVTTSTEQSVNIVDPKSFYPHEPEFPKSPVNNQSLPQHSYQPPHSHPSQPNYYQPAKPQHVSCTTGFRFSEQHQQCIDINECLVDPYICSSNEDCYNTLGSFICNCKNGFTKDFQTGACIDVNECQLGQHDCIDGQRCDNTIGSFACSRTTGCGTGYTLNTASGQCEDDNECLLGTHNCHDLGPKFQCRNTLGSYRCERKRCIGDCFIRQIFTSTTRYATPTRMEPTQSYPIISGQLKKCLPGYRMTSGGVCEDINECDSNPCPRGQKCLNLSGRFQCIPSIQCKAGYELNEAGDGCIDVNECTRGSHKCKGSQVCKNGPGYYMCQCPPGHKMNQNNDCEDIDECEYYRGRTCSINANCINIVGSYICRCKDGFREKNNGCEDVDECGETTGLCQQTCVNLWGSYRCSCERGFTLNTDNRTCTDINECDKFKDKKLCIGTCQNTPGSYKCRCPDGYRIGSDGRTCQDIDECQQNICQRPDDICFNIRGSHKCRHITCPPNYIKDPEHRSRCKRASNVCDIRDLHCLRLPEQYTYHFITFVSNLPIPEGQVSFFQMKGPAWPTLTANFKMKLLNVRCPRGIQQADDSYFRMNREPNRVIVSLVRSIEGPQEMELELEMQLYISDVFNGMVISKILIIVSEYPF